MECYGLELVRVPMGVRATFSTEDMIRYCYTQLIAMQLEELRKKKKTVDLRPKTKEGEQDDRQSYAGNADPAGYVARQPLPEQV
jgi:hypothetical protein